MVFTFDARAFDEGVLDVLVIDEIESRIRRRLFCRGVQRDTLFFAMLKEQVLQQIGLAAMGFQRRCFEQGLNVSGKSKRDWVARHVADYTLRGVEPQERRSTRDVKP